VNDVVNAHTHALAAAILWADASGWPATAVDMSKQWATHVVRCVAKLTGRAHAVSRPSHSVTLLIESMAPFVTSLGQLYHPRTLSAAAAELIVTHTPPRDSYLDNPGAAWLRAADEVMPRMLATAARSNIDVGLRPLVVVIFEELTAVGTRISLLKRLTAFAGTVIDDERAACAFRELSSVAGTRRAQKASEHAAYCNNQSNLAERVWRNTRVSHSLWTSNVAQSMGIR
jgi:hypothetical protein